MIQRRLSGNIAIRASVPILLVVMIVVLLQSVSAGQNNTALDIGCVRGLGSRYSLEAQVEMGRSYAQEVETTFKLITDPVITEYVNRITQRLVRNSDSQIRFTIKIIETDEIDAYSLPGGFVFVDSGLILAVDNEAELAGVIAHEIAHVAACHAAQELAREELTNLVSAPLIFRLLLRRITLNTSYLEPIRSFESEADFLAIRYLYKAGYDPQALSSFFEKLKAMEKQKPGNLAKAFESHPHIADRIKRSQQEINKLPPTAEYKVDTSDFQGIRKRLFELENGHKLDRNHGGDGPTLERRLPTTMTDAGANSDEADTNLLGLCR